MQWVITMYCTIKRHVLIQHLYFTYGMGELVNTIVLILCDTEIRVLKILYMYTVHRRLGFR